MKGDVLKSRGGRMVAISCESELEPERLVSKVDRSIFDYGSLVTGGESRCS